MKTIRQAILDEVYYPINRGLVENKLLARGLDPDQECSSETFKDSAFLGALADSLYSLIQAVNVSEGDKSVGSLTDAQRSAIINHANNLYKSIGEEELTALQPMVYINC